MINKNNRYKEMAMIYMEREKYFKTRNFLGWLLWERLNSNFNTGVNLGMCAWTQ